MGSERSARKDPVPRLRAALRQLAEDVGNPTYAKLSALAPTDDNDEKLLRGSSTPHDLLNSTRRPKLTSVTAFIAACKEYSKRTQTRSRHQELTAAGRFDLETLAACCPDDLTLIRGTSPGRSTPRQVATRVRRSAYLRQVERIAPPELIDRQEELAELAAFCLAPGSGPYTWWRAGPWAGKSALMSTFVMHPPEQIRDQARIVSFFITARLAAQDTRQAFTSVLLEQLAGLTGQDLPPTLSEETREAYLLDLLHHASDVCLAAGSRLVLVVDGLDEDRGVTLGPDAHSIAGLLPSDPPAGMRVIVAGRLNPPVPDDVPDWHPLRDPGIVRLLEPSDYARDLERLSQSELRRLLKGTPVEQDLLGLLAAAHGGLSGPDLEELTGVPVWEIEDVLHTVAGRTFTRRVATWVPETGPAVYLLGHEELQATATRYLGQTRLAGYRDRLHAWADTYRDRGWPPGAPEYLLTGYYRLLQQSGDLPRMTALAADATRHDRMLDITGGDAAALTETRAALEAVAAHDTPDLAEALGLAHHRDQLLERNIHIPIRLPAVWAAIGQITRAEALIASLPAPDSQSWALAEVAGALARAGQHDQADATAVRAEQVARTIADPRQQAEALAEVAVSLALAGQHERAAKVASLAERVADGITGQSRHAWALSRVATAHAHAGQHQRATAAAAHFERIASTITGQEKREWMLAAAAGAFAQAGQHERAEQIASTITGQEERGRALAQIADALAHAGQHERAEQIASTITDLFFRTLALTSVAGALAGGGKYDVATSVAEKAAQITDNISDPDLKAQALTLVARALAQAEQHDHAAAVAEQTEQVAHGIIPIPEMRERVLTAVAGALAEAGQHEQAAALAEQAETVAHSITDPDWQERRLARVACAMARAGQHERAETMTCSITDPEQQAYAMTAVAGALAEAGQHEQAAALAEQAETVAHSITDPERQADAMAEVVEALAEAGQHEQAAALAEQAETVAHSITDPERQADIVARVVQALARVGQHQRAEMMAHSITDSDTKALALESVVEASARAGQHERAEALANSITDPWRQARAFAQVASALAKDGQHERAEALACSITDPGWKADALSSVVEALAKTGATRSARRVAAAYLHRPFSARGGLMGVGACSVLRLASIQARSASGWACPGSRSDRVATVPQGPPLTGPAGSGSWRW